MKDSTGDTFKEKWEHNSQLAFRETLREGSDIFGWILRRNGFETPGELKKYLKNKNRILDAGCGNGRVTALLRRYAPRTAEIVGVDLVSSEIARNNLKTRHLSHNVIFLKRNLLGDLKDLGKFNFIYCQEVLHHIREPERGFQNLCRRLSPRGEIAIYVYKRKAPIREFVDDYLRGIISKLNYNEAIRVCKQITELGKSLSEYGIKIRVPRVESLEIEEGQYDLQRFVYYFFMKCFWNPSLTSQENVAINFDWYHPQIATRHRLEEVREWFKRAKLGIVHENADFYGITVRGKLE